MTRINLTPKSLRNLKTLPQINYNSYFQLENFHKTNVTISNAYTYSSNPCII